MPNCSVGPLNYVKGFPPPAPLVFTPPKINAVEETEIVENVKVLETAKEAPAVKSCECEESDWETIEDCDNDCENDFPAIDVTTGPRSLLKVSKGFTTLEKLLIVKTVVGYLPQNISVKP